MRTPMDNKKKKISLISYVIFALLAGLILWPTSRIYVQQGLMKLGFFKPKLETPKEPTQVTQQVAAVSTSEAASFVNDKKEAIQTSDLKGKVVFINFWATWCPPCRAEMPSIQVLYDKFKDDDQVVFLIVEIDGNIEGTAKFLTEQKIELPIVYPNGDIPATWLGGSIPTTVILDKSGNIAAREEGMYDYGTKEAEDFIRNLVKKAS